MLSINIIIESIVCVLRSSALSPLLFVFMPWFLLYIKLTSYFHVLCSYLVKQQPVAHPYTDVIFLLYREYLTAVSALYRRFCDLIENKVICRSWGNGCKFRNFTFCNFRFFFFLSIRDAMGRLTAKFFALRKKKLDFCFWAENKISKIENIYILIYAKTISSSPTLSAKVYNIVLMIGAGAVIW